MMSAFTTNPAASGRITRQLLLSAILAAAVLLASSSGLHAASIGVSFAPTGIHNLPSGASAGVVPQTNWQNVTTLTATGLTLIDNSGAATTTALTYTGGSGLGNHSALAAVGDEWLMDTWLSNFSGTQTFTISGIPYAAYDLLIYNLPIFSGIKYTYTVGATSYFGNSPTAGLSSPGYIDNNGGTPFNYVQAVSTNTATPTASSTYARFDGLTGGTLTFSITGANGVAFANGFQIVEAVPEPSRAVLAFAGLIALVVRRSRRLA